jgi:hypothetical protein
VFDWWVMNEDRYLGPSGGNVNLLWTESDSGLHLIDHNLAFDPGFDEAQFLTGHVFQAAVGEADGSLWEAAIPVLRRIAGRTEALWKELPEEWTEDAGFGYTEVAAVHQRLDAAARLFGGAKT